MTDELYMRRALELAKLGMGNVSPNPMVGAVIVSDRKIIGEGWHKHYGDPHAEVNAVSSIEDAALLADSTIYVTLEPCSHWGKTPPCADMIIEKGIPRAVVGIIDPNPEVAGNGIKKMIEAGVEVTVGVLEDECRMINKRFFTVQQFNRPYIILKWAQSSDGFLDACRSGGTSAAWMTGPEARILVHRWRSEEDAIMVGTNTVILDNPSLTVRDWHGRNPMRIVPDADLRLDPSYAVFNGEARTIFFTRHENFSAAVKKFSDNLTVEVIGLDFSEGMPGMTAALNELRIGSLFVEGGASLLDSFIQASLWDEARVFTSSRSLTDLYPSLTDPKGIHAPVLPFGTPTDILSNSDFSLKIISQ